MLILSRYVGQSLRIGEELTVSVKDVSSLVAQLSVKHKNHEFDVICPLSNPVEIIPAVIIVFSKIMNGKVQLGVEAPKELKIVRLPDFESIKINDKWRQYLDEFKTLDTTKHRVIGARTGRRF